MKKNMLVAVLLAFVATFTAMIGTAGTASAHAPCTGSYCNEVTNMTWALNTGNPGVDLGVYNYWSDTTWTWLLHVGNSSGYITADVDAYYIGSNFCAKRFVSNDGSNFSELSYVTGPVKVDAYTYKYNRVYVYSTNWQGSCNY